MDGPRHFVPRWQFLVLIVPMRSHIGNPRKNLPNQLTQFATLEIDTVSVTEGREQKATALVAFFICKEHGFQVAHKSRGERQRSEPSSPRRKRARLDGRA
jgi:hypothetical protein